MSHAEKILKNVEKCIDELENANVDWHNPDPSRMKRYGYGDKKVFIMDAVYDELSIFDWWEDTLSVSQLKKMQRFLKTAIKLGFVGYVCFKVGAAGCSHGMWAHKEESTTGYSPDGDVLFHAFRNGDNDWDIELDGKWLHDKYEDKRDFTLADVKAELRKAVA